MSLGGARHGTHATSLRRGGLPFASVALGRMPQDRRGESDASLMQSAFEEFKSPDTLDRQHGCEQSPWVSVVDLLLYGSDSCRVSDFARKSLGGGYDAMMLPRLMCPCAISSLPVLDVTLIS